MGAKDQVEGLEPSGTIASKARAHAGTPEWMGRWETIPQSYGPEPYVLPVTPLPKKTENILRLLGLGPLGYS